MSGSSRPRRADPGYRTMRLAAALAFFIMLSLSFLLLTVGKWGIGLYFGSRKSEI